MKSREPYRVVEREQALDEGQLAGMLAEQDQLLLPIMDLVLGGKKMIDAVIDHMGRGVIAGLLELSAREVAGPPRRGKCDDQPGLGGTETVHRFGYQQGVVSLSDRQLRGSKPRLRTRGTKRTPSKEVPVPAYQAMREHPGAGKDMLRLLSRGVSTRDYKSALHAMAGTLGVSTSSASREFIERTEMAHDELRNPAKNKLPFQSTNSTYSARFSKANCLLYLCERTNVAPLR